MADFRTLALKLYSDGLRNFDIKVPKFAELSTVLKPNEVLPYKSIDDVMEFLWSVMENGLPDWVAETAELTPGTSYCYPQWQMFDTSRSGYKRNTVPKTLVCHDYKGGYLQDRFVKVNWDGTGDFYAFTQWSVIDTFVYFSHYLVTVPPVCWINAGHAHGVSVLGTLITEGAEGRAVWDIILASPCIWEWFAESLTLISAVHKFDGYLINVENTLSSEQVPKMIKFLEHLHGKLPKSSQVIWYDSVTNEGNLDWQNELNTRNADFFDVCDGIFLNYTYRDWQLEMSSLMAGERKHDVYVGVDVFGRGCPGLGFFASSAVAMARSHDLSVAIFAPGWTREAAPGIAVLNDRIFWSSLARYLYVHGSGDLQRTKYLLADVSDGSNYNHLLDGQQGDVFRWVGEKVQIMFALLPPTTNPLLEHRVLLDLQEAVVTFKKKAVDEYYARLPSPLVLINHLGNYTQKKSFAEYYVRISSQLDAINDLGNYTQDVEKISCVKFPYEITELQVPLMFTEVPLRGGVNIDMVTQITSREIEEYKMINLKGPQGYIIIDETSNGKLRTYKFPLSFDKLAWSKDTITMQSNGILMEVGLLLCPQFLACVKIIKISPFSLADDDVN